jgi:oxysterol-binding protein 1
MESTDNQNVKEEGE